MEIITSEIENLCKTLLETYNTSIIDRAYPEFRRALYEEAKKCATDNKYRNDLERVVLMDLINNNFNENDPSVPVENKKPIADFIGGPQTLTLQWSEYYKKLIYIFGEKHSTLTDCPSSVALTTTSFSGIRRKHEMNAEDYLKQLLVNTDVFIDFYFETEKDNKWEGMDKSRISSIYNRFRGCLHDPISRSKKECLLSRTHYFDIRKKAKDIKRNTASEFCDIILDMNKLLLLNGTLSNPKPKNIKVLNNFFSDHSYSSIITSFLTDLKQIRTYEEYYAFWDKQIDDFEFLNKKVDRATEPEKKIIKEFIKKEFRLFKTDIIHPVIKTDMISFVLTSVLFITKIIDKYRNTAEEELYETTDFIYDFNEITDEDYKLIISAIDNVTMHVVNINSLISDFYLLSRVFKDFDIELIKKDLTKTDLSKIRSTDEPKQPHNVIIYAGDGHSNRYRKFLEEELGFKMIHTAGIKWPIDEKVSKLEYKNCINMQDFPQPFFNNLPQVDWLYRV